jgi:hypothetical protein
MSLLAALSAVSYFLCHDTFWSMIAIILVLGVPGVVMALWRKNIGWCFLVVLGILFGSVNAFTGHVVNSLFLNAFGVRGSAVIVHSTETNTMLNYQYVWEHNVVLKTAGGQDVPTTFATDTASIYPVRNEILIPPEGQTFVVKYVPGFERNFVIMSDESEYGRERLIRADLEPVKKAEAQLAVSPANRAFVDEYRGALRMFLQKHRGDADPALVSDCEQKLHTLGAASQ